MTATTWQEALTLAKQASQRRRECVLAHADLTKRLTEPPLRLNDPQKWSGWIPPKTAADERVSNSPVRRQLILIVAEALAREQDR